MEQTIKPIGNLQNIIDKTSLEWIFVGGKGGVGKTTISCSLAIQLAKKLQKVLIISTDPAHNLSDAFNQKISSTATPIKGFTNLDGIEIDPKEAHEGDLNMNEILGVDIDKDTQDIFNQLSNSIPGIDEAMCIGILLKTVKYMNYNAVIFDTAPTGHTLHLLSFPAIMEKGLTHLSSMKNNMNGLMTGLLGQMGQGIESLTEMLTVLKDSIESIHKEFINKDKTTFISVCIPEFLSVYETGRLTEKLDKEEIDCCNIVINQVLFPDPNCQCDMCESRFAMQKKYIHDIICLYSSSYISIIPLQENEIRGLNDLAKFSNLLLS